MDYLTILMWVLKICAVVFIGLVVGGAGRGVGRAEGDVGGAIGEALDDGHHGR
jgi:hypothetical protein